MGQFNDFLSRRIGKRSAVYVNATQLIDAAVTGRWTSEQRTLADRRCMAMHYTICKMKRIFTAKHRVSQIITNIDIVFMSEYFVKVEKLLVYL